MQISSLFSAYVLENAHRAWEKPFISRAEGRDLLPLPFGIALGVWASQRDTCEKVNANCS